MGSFTTVCFMDPEQAAGLETEGVSMLLACLETTRQSVY
jgi:hypothetical protein